VGRSVTTGRFFFAIGSALSFMLELGSGSKKSLQAIGYFSNFAQQKKNTAV